VSSTLLSSSKLNHPSL
jgi:hypothetical protein